MDAKEWRLPYSNGLLPTFTETSGICNQKMSHCPLIERCGRRGAFDNAYSYFFFFVVYHISLVGKIISSNA